MANEPVILRTPSATIRPWKAEDYLSLPRHADNPRIAAHMRDGFPSPYTPDDARRFISISATASRGLLLAIEVDGEAAGGIGIHPLDDVYKRTAELGYWLSEDFWGKGIVTGAVQALVPFVFLHTDLVRLQSGVFSGNPASARVLEKCGFTLEAVHRNAVTKNNVLRDELLYVLLREEWDPQIVR